MLLTSIVKLLGLRSYKGFSENKRKFYAKSVVLNFKALGDFIADLSNQPLRL